MASITSCNKIHNGGVTQYDHLIIACMIIGYRQVENLRTLVPGFQDQDNVILSRTLRQRTVLADESFGL